MQSIRHLAGPLAVFALSLAATAGCAELETITRRAAPIAAAACSVLEQRACAAHTSTGIPETDPRAVAVHAAARAVDSAHTGEELAPAVANLDAALVAVARR